MAGVDDYRSSNNRQDLDVVSAQQAYSEARAREDERRRRQDLSNDPYTVMGVDGDEMRDWKTIQRFEHNFGPCAALSTLEQGDAIEPKR
jgi:hypothetical protein